MAILFPFGLSWCFGVTTYQTSVIFRPRVRAWHRIKCYIPVTQPSGLPLIILTRKLMADLIDVLPAQRHHSTFCVSIHFGKCEMVALQELALEHPCNGWFLCDHCGNCRAKCGNTCKVYACVSCGKRTRALARDLVSIRIFDNPCAWEHLILQTNFPTGEALIQEFYLSYHLDCCEVSEWRLFMQTSVMFRPDTMYTPVPFDWITSDHADVEVFGRVDICAARATPPFRNLCFDSFREM